MKTRILLLAAFIAFSVTAQANETTKSNATPLSSLMDVFFPSSCAVNPNCRDKDNS